MHLRVDVHRAALVPAGIDRRELGDAVLVGHLRAAQERVVLLGVAALGVAVPEVDDRVGERLALGVAHAQRELELVPSWPSRMSLRILSASK